MTKSQREMFERWLESDDPVERAAARHRLAVGDAPIRPKAEQSASDDDVARAIAMIQQFPPDFTVRVGGCCGG